MTDVACPTCGQPAGKGCRSYGGAHAAPHAARVRAHHRRAANGLPVEIILHDIRYTPRIYDGGGHGWIRHYQGRRNEVGAEVRYLLDEIARLSEP